MNTLKPCPCGDTSQHIEVIPDTPDKWAYAVPDCCGEWSVEFRAGYADYEEAQQLAIIAWNDAPRAKP